MHNKNTKTPEMKKHRVLIVDDVLDNLQVISNILAEKDVEISFATDGIQALETIRNFNPDLILLDINMPGMDGLEVCSKIVNDPVFKEIPVIFLTARSETEDIIKGFETGAVDYITKPFNATEVLVRVFNHLNLKNAKDIIRRQNDQLRELNAMKDKFFSIVAHDIKNPVSLFITTAQYIHENFDSFEPGEAKGFLEVIYSSSQRLMDLINNLLQWSKSQSGRMDVRPSEINLFEIAKGTFQAVTDLAVNKNIDLVNDINQDTYAYADENMIFAVIRNLVSNAIKYTPKGGKIVLFSEDLGAFTRISVKDNGVGIKNQDLEKLFRIDVNFFTPGTENEQGTGLGLILCKEFVTKNNGSIRVESIPGIGSTFMVDLPKKSKKE